MANCENIKAQPTLTGHIASVWLDASAALAEMPKASRWFHVFWLMGPFILVIEQVLLMSGHDLRACICSSGCSETGR